MNNKKFEIWSKKAIPINSICKLGNMKFKILKSKRIKEGYALLCLLLEKIAMLTPTYHYYSGVDRLTESRAITESKIGHDVTIFTSEATIKPKW